MVEKLEGGETAMVASSSGFLTKSIVVLSLFLVSMGVSVYLGKMVGRDIMALTRSNIEERFPGALDASSGSQSAFQETSGRSQFGFDPASFAPEQAPAAWAQPEADQFSTVRDEAVVEISLLPEEQQDAAEEADTQPEEASEKPQEERVTDSDSIFQLSGSSLFRIQVGTFSKRENAENVWRSLTSAGFDAHITVYNDADGEKYKVSVGAYKTREEADRVAERLRSMNFDAWVYQER